LEFLALVVPADDGELVADLNAVAAEFEAAEKGGGLKLFRRLQRVGGSELQAVVCDQRRGVGLCGQVVT
jgi:hypothetical protein